MAFLFAPLCAAFAQSSVILAWDASPDPSVVGYNLYWGPQTRTYTNVLSSQGTSMTISITPGAAYFFAATCVTAAGLESDYSVELPLQATNMPPPIPIPYVTVLASAAGIYTDTRVVLAEFSVPATAPKQFFRLRVHANQIWLDSSDLPDGPWSPAEVWTNWMAPFATDWQLEFQHDFEVLL